MRKINLIFTSLFLLCTQLQAISLDNEVQLVNSRVFQPFYAKIEVFNVPKDIDVSKVVVELAEQSMYLRLAQDRQFFLTKLDFVFKHQNGRYFIEITSRDLIKESYLMMIVKLQVGTTQLYRDYVLLFDAPIAQ